ncbi:S41 family peptidase [candidate division KSB1 bacterium]|nr:S41 family peptidase [candidate division KSB1 bacterium]
MKKRSNIKYLMFGLGAALFISVIFFSWNRVSFAAKQALNKWMILTMIIDKIERFYVDEKDTDALFEYAVNGILNGLDPYSRYLRNDEYNEWKKRYQGYYGVGISYELIDGDPVVISLAENSPAQLQGIELGDHIVQIGGISVKNKSHNEIQELLVGPQASLVELKIKRTRQSDAQVYRLYRQQIQVASIPCAYMLRKDIGYINILHFTESTPTELDIAFTKLSGDGMNKLVLDLRNNTGGALEAGIAVADRFLTAGKLIVSTKGRSSKSTEQYIATKENTLSEIPLVILVNGNTASDAEIVAGAIQDWDRGLIVGTKTYGKALVQSEFQFQDGSVLLLTTARYYTPLGRLIQSEFPDSETSKSVVVKKFKTRKGRIVTGGGGISPDILIADTEVDETFQNFYLTNRYLFYSYADQFVRDSSLTDINFDDYIQHFLVTENMLSDFYHFAKDAGSFSNRFMDQDKKLTSFALKKEIAGRLWGEKGRFILSAFYDHQVNRSMDFFNQAEKLLK